MRNIKPLVFAAVSCVVMAGSLSAQMATGKDKLVGVNGAWSTYSNGGSTTWSVYTSPYKAQFWVNSGSSVVPPSTLLPPAGVDAFGPTTDLFCVDFNHESYLNTTYPVNYTNLGTNAADVGVYTRAGVDQSTQLQHYLEAAYLAQQVYVNGVGSAAAADINGAIWQIMSGSPTYRWNSITSTWDASGISNWVTLAGSNWGSVNASNWVVVTDQAAAGKGEGIGTAGSQEYITQVTPEPATLLLMGTGLLAMILAGAVLRRPTA